MHENWWLFGSPYWDKLHILNPSCRIPVDAGMPYRKRAPLDSRVQCRLAKNEKREVLDQADKAGMTLSAYFRRRLLGRKVNAKTDEQMVRELRRLGGLAKELHNRSGGVYRKETAEVLESVSRAIDRIGRSSAP